MNYKENYNKWISSKSLSLEEYNELNGLSKSEIVSKFSEEIDFGTGGIRALMSLGLNGLNRFTVAKVTHGLALFLLDNLSLIKQYNLDKAVVIAYDNRANSKLFGDIAAKVLAHYGFKAYVYDSLRTTPQLSFSVRYLKCMAGIMITASHNPKEYNGYKVYNHFGGQLINSEAKEVKKYISKVEDYMNLELSYDESLIVKLEKDIDEAFYKCALDSVSNKDYSNLTIIYSPSHGTGLVPVSEVLRRTKTNLILVEETSYPSETFENLKSPNPEDKASYALGIDYLKKYNGDILLVTDPDCDRIGACVLDKDNNPVYINGNLMGLLITNYILSSKEDNALLNAKSTIISTRVSSCLIKKLVDSYNVIYKEVFTGFKNIASMIINEDIDYIFGFEESYGYLVNPYVRDKDAVQASLIIAEMTSFYKKQGKTLLDMIDEIFNKFGRVNDSQFNIVLKGENALSLKDTLMNKAYNFNLDDICGYKIKNVYNYNIGLDKFGNKIETGDNLVKIVFEDDSFICVRPSGTEPKVKTYYSIIGDNNKVNQIKDFFINYLNPNNGTVFKLDGVLVERIWGGHYFKDELKLTDSEANFGELWSASGYKGYESKILNKDNISLRDFYQAHKDLFANSSEEEFPILIKLIATSDKLSVQVHPDDKYAKEIENGSGKKEGWLILDSKEDSKLVIGHKAKSKEELIKLVNEKKYNELLDYRNVEKGEFYPIPSGTIHAIGKDIVLLEVQQSSDITYRFYDYDRKDKNSNLRPLHIQKAIDVVSINPYDIPIHNCFKENIETLWDCEYFKVDYKKISGTIKLSNDSFKIITILKGNIYINGNSFGISESGILCSDAKEYKSKN